MFEIIFIIGLVFLILEIFTPAMFFLNLAIASFLTSIVALYTSNINVLTITFVLLSFVALTWIRPLLMKTRKDNKTGIEDKYIGKIVKVIKSIDKYSGAITIYDERWEARVENDEIIPEGVEVKIIRNESLIMYVERVK